MPFIKSNYPNNWKAFSQKIRFERAQNKCEKCGAVNYQPHPQTGSKVILTVAHLDYENGPCKCFLQSGMKCTVDNHVLALCQKCHNILDNPARQKNARNTRIEKADSKRGLFQVYSKRV